MATTKILRDELAGAIPESKEHSQADPSLKLRFSMHRRKKTVLWFGLIEKFTGRALGALAYKDGERYKRVMLEFNITLSNMSHLVGQQMHVVLSELQKLHSLAEVQEKEIKCIKLKVINSAAGIERLSDGIAELTYINTLENLPTDL